MLFDGLGDDDRHLPHCEAEIEVRLEAQAALAPPLRLAFASVPAFALWLKASRLSVDDSAVAGLRVDRDQLEPLVRAGLTMLTTRRMTSGIAISLDRRRERGSRCGPHGERRACSGRAVGRTERVGHFRA
jgi:hypothetical protein